MNKPERKVMSMVPNQQYLHGYNDCVEESQAFNRKATDLLVGTVTTQGMPPKDAPFYDELKEFLTDELRRVHERVLDSD